MRSTTELAFEAGIARVVSLSQTRMEALDRFRQLVRNEALEEAAAWLEDQDGFDYDDPGGNYARQMRVALKT